jgi:hypothetical protein
MSYKSALISAALVLGFGLYSAGAVAQPLGLCTPPCKLGVFFPCPTCGPISRCYCPPAGAGGPGSYGRAEIHRKNVPQTHKNKAPGPND